MIVHNDRACACEIKQRQESNRASEDAVLLRRSTEHGQRGQKLMSAPLIGYPYCSCGYSVTLPPWFPFRRSFNLMVCTSYRRDIASSLAIFLLG